MLVGHLVSKDLDSSSMQVEPSTSTIDQMTNQEQDQDLQIDTNHQENDQDPPNDNGGQDLGDSSPRTLALIGSTTYTSGVLKNL